MNRHNSWSLDTPVAFLSTCHLGVLFWMAILSNLVYGVFATKLTWVSIEINKETMSRRHNKKENNFNQ